MGTISARAFDNDDALDWFDRLESSGNAKLLEKTLKEAAKASEADVCLASSAIAASELVAAALGQPSIHLPPQVLSWLEKRRVAPGAELVKLAMTEVKDVEARSELRELWEESGVEEWLKETSDLLSRLGKAKSKPPKAKNPSLKPQTPPSIDKLVAALKKAAKETDIEAREKILEPFCRAENATLFLANRETLLHHLAGLGLADCAARMIEFGAVIEAVNAAAHTPLMLACKNGHADVARVLVERGADVSRRTWAGYPIINAIYGGNTEVVDLLVQTGANCGEYDPLTGTLLHQAAVYGKAEMVGCLVKHGIDPNRKDSRGETPMHAAVNFSHPKFVEALLANGGDINTVNEQGDTPLDQAIHFENAKMVRFLKKHGGCRRVDLKNGR